MLRALVERFSRNIVLKRRLPARVGGESIFVSPDSALKFWRWNLEHTDPLLFDLATKFVSRGNVVWDIGANVGLFAFAAAGVAGVSGRVFAVEADPWLVDLLRRSAGSISERGARVEVLPFAVSDSVGPAKFNIAARGRSANFLEVAAGSDQAGGVRKSVIVETMTVDCLLETIPPPVVLKVDVEGAELRVLSGGKRLLSSIQPIIACEVSSANGIDVARLLRASGYTLYDLERLDVTAALSRSAAFNTLAWPREKYGDLPKKMCE
jgi:FkbM family methyltransferase